MVRAFFAAGVMLLGGMVYSTFAVAQQPLAASSEWVNALGSVMTIEGIGTDGLITGTYVSAVGCGAGKTRPLTGWYNADAITFTVNFQECKSATSWTGNVGLEGDTIVTLWQLAISGPPEWDSINAGADTFQLQ